MSEFLTSYNQPRMGQFLRPVTWIDTAGNRYCVETKDGTRTYNIGESLLVQQVVEELIRSNDAVQSAGEIAVITPYNRQKRQITDLFTRVGIWKHEQAKKRENIRVSTIDSMQGQESDIVILSMTRSNQAGRVGFLKDSRRINVALSRARKLLVIIGDSRTLDNREMPALPHYLKYCSQGHPGSALYRVSPHDVEIMWR